MPLRVAQRDRGTIQFASQLLGAAHAGKTPLRIFRVAGQHEHRANTERSLLPGMHRRHILDTEEFEALHLPAENALSAGDAGSVNDGFGVSRTQVRDDDAHRDREQRDDRCKPGHWPARQRIQVGGKNSDRADAALDVGWQNHDLRRRAAEDYAGRDRNRAVAVDVCKLVYFLLSV